MRNKKQQTNIIRLDFVSDGKTDKTITAMTSKDYDVSKELDKLRKLGFVVKEYSKRGRSK